MNEFYNKEIKKIMHEIHRLDSRIKKKERIRKNLKKEVEIMLKQSKKTKQKFDNIYLTEKKVENLEAQIECLQEMKETYYEQQYRYLKLREDVE